jgi:hypothetical protein
VTALAGRGPAGIGRLPARQLAHRELSKAIYQPSVFLRIDGAVARWLESVLRHVGIAHHSWWAVLALIVLAVVVISAVAVLSGPSRWARRREPVRSPGSPVTAADHRQAAARLAEAGDYAGAIAESVRAIEAELEARSVLLARPGRTADELAAEAGEALPAHAAGLRRAADLFDDVRYGGRPGSAAGYRQVQDLDASLGRTRPNPAPAAGPPAADPAVGGAVQ